MNRPDGISDIVWETLEGPTYAKRYAWVLGHVEGRVLDIGCAQGHLACTLALAGHEVTAIDIVPGLVACTRRMQEANGCAFPANIGNAYATGFADDSFDTVTITEVIEHLDDPASALAEAARVAPHVIITCPAYLRIPHPGHVWDFTVAALDELVASAGLRVIEHTVDEPWQYVDAVRA
jgi:2-polyprenyl-3-methyl-5-hydroxy-6-metoxy-1,4-benzoquinol methylase